MSTRCPRGRDEHTLSTWQAHADLDEKVDGVQKELVLRSDRQVRRNLGCISAVSPLYLRCVSAPSPLYLGCISAASRLYLRSAGSDSSIQALAQRKAHHMRATWAITCAPRLTYEWFAPGGGAA